MSSLQKDVLKKNLPPLPRRPADISQGDGMAAAGKPSRRRRDYSPLPWSQFFDRYEDVVTAPGNCFRVYFKGFSGPILLLLHGGGHSALSWAVLAVAVSKLVECEVVAVDLRGHGETCTVDDHDLSADTLVDDVGAVAEAVAKSRDPPTPTVLVGHSMGGAIAVRAAVKGVIPVLIGLIVIDVVEGTAMESLGSMQNFLRDRPSHFKSVEAAIEWSIRSGQLRNVESARVSMPAQVKSAVKATSKATPESSTAQHTPPLSSTSCIQEEEEEVEGKGTGREGQGDAERSQDPAFLKPLAPPSRGSHSGSTADVSKFVWRVELKETECYWKGWFNGLSQLFLSIPVPKMLLLAGVDRLDKELTIGQMQGKFWMQVLSGCGHSVHEDAPDKVAKAISGFLTRNKFAKGKEQEEEEIV